jgi:hypothetical protein
LSSTHFLFWLFIHLISKIDWIFSFTLVLGWYTMSIVELVYNLSNLLVRLHMACLDCLHPTQPFSRDAKSSFWLRVRVDAHAYLNQLFLVMHARSRLWEEHGSLYQYRDHTWSWMILSSVSSFYIRHRVFLDQFLQIDHT